MNKKVYFSGSIRGGRQDAALYEELIHHIQKTDTVLTEHIGNAALEVIEKDQSDEDIYLQDIGYLKECDLVIAECTTASLGVGYELAYAEAHGKPCHIFYDPSRTKLSAMLAGDKYFSVHPYHLKEELLTLVDNILVSDETHSY